MTRHGKFFNLLMAILFALSVCVALLVVLKECDAESSEWSDEKPLSNYTEDSSHFDCEIDDNVVHVTWYNGKENGLYYMKSFDYGSSWEFETKVLVHDVFSVDMEIENEIIYIAYVYYYGDGKFEMGLLKSDDNGQSWTDTKPLFTDDFEQEDAQVRATNSTIYLFWMDSSEEDGIEVYYMKSTNKGENWTEKQRLSNATKTGGIDYDVVLLSDELHFFYHDQIDGVYQIKYRDTTNGENWSEETLLFNNSKRPNVCVENNTLQIVYELKKEVLGIPEYYLAYSSKTSGNKSWKNSSLLFYDESGFDSLAVSANTSNLHVYFIPKTNDQEIYALVSFTNGENWSDSVRISNNSGKYNLDDKILISDSRENFTLCSWVYKNKTTDREKIFYSSAINGILS